MPARPALKLTRCHRLVLEILARGERPRSEIEGSGLGDELNDLIAAGRVRQIGSQMGLTTIRYVRLA